MKLLSQSAFAREIGCSQQAISRACKPGKPLHDALVDGRKLDIDSKAAIAWVDDREKATKIKKKLKKPKPKPKPEPQPPSPPTELVEAEPDPLEQYKNGDADIRSMANRTLDWITSRFGAAAEFREWIKAVHELEKTHERRIKNMVAEGQLVSRRIIKQGIIDPIEECLNKLLTDGSKTMAIDCHAKTLGGRTVEELETYIRETQGKFIRPAKERMVRTLKSLKGDFE
jgi:hypothetical protein